MYCSAEIWFHAFLSTFFLIRKSRFRSRLMDKAGVTDKKILSRTFHGMQRWIKNISKLLLYFHTFVWTYNVILVILKISDKKLYSCIRCVLIKSLVNVTHATWKGLIKLSISHDNLDSQRQDTIIIIIWNIIIITNNYREAWNKKDRVNRWRIIEKGRLLS